MLNRSPPFGTSRPFALKDPSRFDDSPSSTATRKGGIRKQTTLLKEITFPSEMGIRFLFSVKAADKTWDTGVHRFCLEKASCAHNRAQSQVSRTDKILGQLKSITQAGAEEPNQLSF